MDNTGRNVAATLWIFHRRVTSTRRTKVRCSSVESFASARIVEPPSVRKKVLQRFQDDKIAMNSWRTWWVSYCGWSGKARGRGGYRQIEQLGTGMQGNAPGIGLPKSMNENSIRNFALREIFAPMTNYLQHSSHPRMKMGDRGCRSPLSLRHR
ncbi:hypothetical protein M413DRAFT_195919 [Hebeloma cylindrosporum]|uniref:Uncharacterized protein n=1 Tax=Hebeloma cylindrosporum TaxID=76867 RepID=A0A0C3C6L2_HEBCY|nr:hypothetical protein M413DRAFT_195919 [Hebeloma cylindrosporum h7]